MSSQKTMDSRGSRRSAKPRKRRGAVLFKRFMVLLLLVLVGIAGYLYYLFDKSKDALTMATADAEPGIVVPAEESVKVKPVGIMLFGMDTRKETGSLNTDVMMVAVMNPTTKSAAVVTIPRDTRIELDGYKSRKANSYYAKFRAIAIDDGLSVKDAEKKAKRQVREMLGKYFGIDIAYTATINFQGFVDVVDALGGVEVDVDMDMHYVDNADGTKIDLKQGHQQVNGDQALDFVRYRKSNDGTNMSSDFDRNKRQSEVIGAIADRMKSFSGVTKLGNVIEAVGNNMRMDMPSSEVQNLIETYFKMGKSDIQFTALEGTWRSPYVYVDDESLRKAKQILQAKMAE
ncbi:LCP family protein [Paenibacillus methanolicus]|uniref:LCP family protein required for cell wall assembly n=1 Tax=Paenibacillus methanolicus TaxID=582686 RepID=A0A5S5CFA3_9BACL|nr:LCP family protein [Paenibacillus methanolicus]TYP77977.1 LCP family protein required for cell wall assembly [Paenibacillus methanolicus]